MVKVVLQLMFSSIHIVCWLFRDFLSLFIGFFLFAFSSRAVDTLSARSYRVVCST